jgi:hypothetical protein
MNLSPTPPWWERAGARLRYTLRGSGAWTLPYRLRLGLGWVLPPWRGRSRVRSVFIVTYGRSGSTLLMNYLNAQPGVRLRGENYLFPVPLRRVEQPLEAAASKTYPGTYLASHPWYGAGVHSVQRWRRGVRRLMLDQAYPRQPVPRTTGFKEIRWFYRTPGAALGETLDWLCELRPPGAVVVLTRDLPTVLSSGWWADMAPDKRERAEDKLRQFERDALAYVEQHPGTAVHITYEDFVAGPAAARRVCSLLGLRFRERTWQKVLARPVARMPRSEAGEGSASSAVSSVSGEPTEDRSRARGASGAELASVGSRHHPQAGVDGEEP